MEDGNDPMMDFSRQLDDLRRSQERLTAGQAEQERTLEQIFELLQQSVVSDEKDGKARLNLSQAVVELAHKVKELEGRVYGVPPEGVNAGKAA